MKIKPFDHGRPQEVAKGALAPSRDFQIFTFRVFRELDVFLGLSGFSGYFLGSWPPLENCQIFAPLETFSEYLNASCVHSFGVKFGFIAGPRLF